MSGDGVDHVAVDPRAAPVLAEAWREATSTTRFATPSSVAMGRMIELGRLTFTKAAPASGQSL
jgi:hypothetical protein